MKIPLLYGCILTISLILLLPASSSAKNSAKEGHLWEYKRKHFNIYTLKDEIGIGEQVQEQQQRTFKKKKTAIDPPAQAALKTRIQTIVNRIAKVSDMPYLPFEVHLYDKPDTVNAYCLPGGKIGVFTGLFDKEKGLVNAASDDEIAAVLSHEIAHATLRHVTRQITTANGVGFLGSLVSMGLSVGVGQEASSIFGQAFNTGTSLMMPNYSRKHEKEADRVGFYYMALAGYDPNAAIRLWDRAAEKKRAKGKSDRTQIFDSHPANGERANYLRSFVPDLALLKTMEKDKLDLHKSMR